MRQRPAPALVLAFIVVATIAARRGDTVARERTNLDWNLRPVPLLPPARCADEYDVQQCSVAIPKEWSIDERHVIQHTWLRLTANELVQGIVVGAQENGYNGLRRYATDTRQDPGYGRVPKFSPGFVLFRSKVLGITDAFFQTADMSDPISGYRFGDVILLHELIHAFDDRQLSIDTGFTSATGWVFRNDRWHYINRVSFSEYNGVVAETMTLYGRGRYRDAWTRDRTFATSLAFPLPTIQSLANPGESFADILAHLILDPKATSYLHRDVVAWFEANVFPRLRDNARRFRPDAN